MKAEDIYLKDDTETSFGGLVHSKETLSEFLCDLEPHEKKNLKDINESLKTCGLLQINKVNYPEIKANEIELNES